MEKNPTQILRDIFINQLNLANDRVIVYNQEFVVPPTSNLFVVIMLQGVRPISSSNRFLDTNEGFKEKIITENQYNYAINFCSKNDDADNMLPKFNSALISTYANYQMDRYGFRIGSISKDIPNISASEGGSMLTRYLMNLNVIAWDLQENLIDFYEDININTIIQE